MIVFCSAREFESLCRDISDRVDVLRLQAKGGSMYPFIRSGDWVNVSFCQGKADRMRKGDLLLFKKDGSLYLHRVLRRTGHGFVVKGDMSFGNDGSIPFDDVLARVISVQRGGQCIDLCNRVNRSIAILSADASIFLQYPVLFFRKVCSLGSRILILIQGLKVFRYMVKKIVNGKVIVRPAGPDDEEQLRDLYCMAGRDIRDGLAQIGDEGFWFVAELYGKIAGGLTMTRYEKDAALWVIFGLEVKPIARGMGIGRAIVEASIMKAKESGARSIGLFVNKRAKPALGLYASLGFEASDDFPPEFNRSCDELYLKNEVRVSPSECRDVADSAVSEGIFYPLYRNLPENMRENLKQMYYLHISKSCDFMSRVERILGCIEFHKIRVLLFKGAAIDSFIYDDFMRPRLDLDLVVRDEDLPALEAVLSDLGYVCAHNDKDCPIPEYLNSRLFIPSGDDLIPVHVHKHLVNNMFFSIDCEFSMAMKKVWDETVSFKEYQYIYMLKPELNIIYLCEHGLKHDFDQIIYLYEIERLICFYGKEFDWKKFVRLAQGFGLCRPAYFGLYFVQKLLSARIQKEAMDVLKPAKLTLGEKSFIGNTLRLQRRRYAAYSVYCAMRPGLVKKIIFIFRTIFPPGFTFKGYVMRLRKLILP